jgi:hypothetical protein
MVWSYDIGSLEAIGGSARMVKKLDCQPGDGASASATYMLCDDLGNPTGLKADFAEGEPLAYAPRGCVWSWSIGGADEKADTKDADTHSANHCEKAG